MRQVLTSRFASVIKLLKSAGKSRRSEIPGQPEQEQLLERLEQRELMTVNVLTPLPDQTVSPGSSNLTISLTGRYDNPAITGTIVRFNTNQPGAANFFNVELFDQSRAAGQESAQSFRNRTTPATVTNFLSYLNAGRYTNTIMHRTVQNFIIQGGGFSAPTAPSNAAGPEADPGTITTFPAVVNEPGNNNVRGTISMAKLGTDPNSATSQWFVNLNDNRGPAPNGLDFQNSGFTAFGRVLGDGMTVVDAMAAVPRYNASNFYGNNALNELPLRNVPSVIPPGQTLIIQPSQFVTVTSIVVINEITYTVTSSNGALVSPTINSNGELVLGFAPGQQGVATITVRAMSADGTFVDDSFNVGVTPVTLGTAAVSPTSIAYAGLPVTVSATDPATAGGATISRINFYRDVNGNGLLDTGTDTLLGSDTDGTDGWSTSVSTAGFPAGSVSILAVAVDSENRSSAPSITTLTVDRSTPVTIGSVGSSITGSLPYLGSPLTLTAGTVATLQPGEDITRIDVYRDVNGNGRVDAGTDTLLGSDTDAAGGWSAVIDTSLLAVGGNTLLTVATDSEGAVSVATATTVNVTLATPVALSTFGVSTTVLARLTDPLTLTAGGPSTIAPGATIEFVRFFRDSNANGVFDVGVDALLGTVTPPGTGSQYALLISNPGAAGFARNNNTVFAVAFDTAGNRSQARIQTVIGAPPVTASPASVNRGSSTILTTPTLTGIGTVQRVGYYRDTNGDGEITPGTDAFLGYGALLGGTYRLTVASTSLAFGANTIMARAELVGGTFANYANSTVTVVNNVPTIASVVSSRPVITTIGTDFNVTATPSDRDGTVSRITVYADNGDGVFNTTDDLAVGIDESSAGGWSVTLSSYTLAAGSYRFFVVATDNNGGESTASLVTIRVNAAPVVGGIAGSSTIRPSTMTLTASNVVDDGSIARVEFYRDNNGNGTLEVGVDTLLGNGTRVGTTTSWTLNISTLGYIADEVGFLARAIDNDGATGAAASGTGIINNASPATPTLTSNIIVLRNPGTSITLTAGGVRDVDGTIARVRFYEDLDADGEIDVSDTLLGEDTSAAGGWTLTTSALTTTGVRRLLAVSIDNEGAQSLSGTVYVRVNAAPTIGTGNSNLTVLGGSVARRSTFVIEATSVNDADGTSAPLSSGVVSRVEFWRDLNANGIIDATDQLLGNGARVGTSTTWRLTASSTGFATGSNTIMARAFDAYGGIGGTRTTTVTVTNLTPTAGTLGSGVSVIATPGVDLLSLTVTGLADLDGSIATVRFYRDSDGTPGLDTATDELLGTDSSATGGWSISAATTGITGASATYYAVIVDNEGATASTVGRTVTVNTRPTVGALTLDLSSAGRPATVVGTVASTGTADTDGTVSRVEFWRDRNDNGTIESTDQLLGNGVRQTNGTWRLSFSTTGFAFGDNTVMARSIDNRTGASTASSATISISNIAPGAGTLTIAPALLVNPGTDRVTLTITGAADPDGTIARVRFYRDTDGSGDLDTGIDELVGTDTSATGGWSVQAETTGVTGTSARYFAVVNDNDGFNSPVVPTAMVNVNQRPTLGADPTFTSSTVARRSNATVSVVSAADADTGGSVTRVEFWRDINNNGTIEAADRLLGNGIRQIDGSYSLTFSTIGFAAGDVTILAQAIDNRGGRSLAGDATLTVTNLAPTFTALTTTTPVVGIVGTDSVVLTLTGAADADGTIARVRFYRDTDGTAGLDTATDTLVGEDTSAAGGWSLTSASTGLTGTSATYFAVVRDNDGTDGATSPSVVIAINQRPTVGAVTIIGSSTVARLTNVTVSIAGVADGDTSGTPAGSIAKVEVWRDRDADGVIDTTDQLLGNAIRQTDGTYRLTFSTAGFAAGAGTAGENTLMVRAIDGRTLATATPSYNTLTVTNVLPTVTRVTVSAALVNDPSLPVTFTVTGAADRDGTIQSAVFYFDVNNNGVLDDGVDVLMGDDTTPGNGLALTTILSTIPGATFNTGDTLNRVLAVVRDNQSALSAPVTTSFRINPAPTVGSVTVNDGSNNLNRLSTTNTLTADGITDNGTISRVEFWLDLNSDGIITAADRLLGVGTRIASSNSWRLIFNGSLIPGGLSGVGNLLTQSVDNLGRASAPTVTSVTIV